MPRRIVLLALLALFAWSQPASAHWSGLAPPATLLADTDAPTAILDAPTTANVGATIPLVGTRSFDVGGGDVIQWTWTVSSRPPVVTPDGTFNAPGLPAGSHTVTLVVRDDSGNDSQPASAQILVRDTTAPTAILSAPNAVDPNATIALTGTSSTDIGGQVAEWRWKVGTRAVVATAGGTFNAPGIATPGPVTVTLVVVDDAGNESAPASRTVNVRDNLAPTAVLDAPATAEIGAAIPLVGTRSSDAGGEVRRWRWTVADRPVVETAEGSFNAPGLPAGRHRITLVVSDDSGNESAAASADVVVRDATAPTAVLDAPTSVVAGATVPLSGSRSTDIGGRIIRYRWTVGTRAPVETPDPSFTAPALTAGTHSVKLVVTDDAGNESAAATRAVTATAPRPPAGTKIVRFGVTTLIAPRGETRSQIDLGDGTLLAGRIFSPKPVKLTATFKSSLGSLGRTTVEVGAGKAVRLQVKLTKKVRKALAGRKKLKVTMRAVTKDASTGKSTATTRKLVFEINR